MKSALFLAWVTSFAFVVGCNATMSVYYGAITSTAVTVTTGYRLLDQKDKEIQSAIVAQAKIDQSEAVAALNAYLPKYDKAKKALDAASFAVETARNAAPVIETAASKSKDIRDWIAKLIALGANIASALGELGVKL